MLPDYNTLPKLTWNFIGPSEGTGVYEAPFCRFHLGGGQSKTKTPKFL